MEITLHYKNKWKFWETDGSSDSQRRAFKCFEELYISDERFTFINGKAQLEFANYLSVAVSYYADNPLI